jgi:PAS domain S-box-containing protein
LRYLLAEGEALAEVGIRSEDLIGKTIFEALPKDAAALYETAVSGGSGGRIVCARTRRTRQNHTSSRGASLRSSSGEVYAALAVSYDISDRKQAEEKLRESETQMRLVVEAAEMGNLGLEFAHGRGALERTAFRLFGREPEEERVLSYRDFESGVHPDDREMVRERLEQAIAQDSVFQTEFRVVLPDRQTRWVSGYGRVVKRDASGKAMRMTGVMFDVTERKAIEEAVRQSEERLRLLVESASDYAIFTVTPENIVESWNAGAEKVFGYAEDEIIGKSGAILFTPEDQKRGVPAMEIECAAETSKAEDERWHIRKDGSRFFASGVMRPLLDGRVGGFVKICRDQTERIQAEKAVRDKEVLKKLVAAQEDERRRIARDLHDHLGQQMTALRLKLANVRESCGDSPICAQIEEIQRAAVQMTRMLIFSPGNCAPPRSTILDSSPRSKITSRNSRGTQASRRNFTSPV